VALPGDVANDAHRRALIAAAGPEIELLVEAGFDVVAQAGDADDLLRKALAHDPGALVADVQMPPGRSDDGLRAAIELRRQHPDTGVLVLSQVYEEHYAMDLLGDRPEGAGYLLKERVGDMEEFIHAVRRVAHRRVLAVLTYLRNATS
jgi:DNA-binding NarL/FixJ family response regulator